MTYPYHKIERAIQNPIEDHPIHAETIALPRPGSNLLSNPKFKIKKGKKKRGMKGMKKK